MTLAPRFLVNFWAGFRVARFGRRIKSLGRGIGAQHAAFTCLMDYAARREQGKLGAPLVRLVMPGVFARWAGEQRKTASASKLPRCRSDRLIADQLAALAPFHQDALAPTRPTMPPF